MRRYLGSKKKILKNIEDFILEQNIKPKRFLDAFSGSGSVTNNFSQKYKTISNDYMYFSYVIASSIVKSNDVDWHKIKEMLITINNLEISSPNSGDFIYNNFSPKGNRMYFTKENALKIDRSRQFIEDIYINKIINDAEYYVLLHILLDSVQTVSNITGTYSAFLKEWDSRALKDIYIENIFDTQKNKNGGNAYNLDIYDFLEMTKKGDLVYLDPPYTSLDYAGAYHVLETISRYDSPSIYGISGRRTNKKKSDFHKKTTVYNAFRKMIFSINEGVDVMISYSSHGLLKLEDIEEIIYKLFPDTKISIKKINYKAYGNINSSSKNNLQEFLILFRTTKPIKAPFNYQGSKEKIVRKIRKIIPLETKEIIEPFVGGFNFGINTDIRKFKINDLSRPVINLLLFLKETKVDSVINEIEMIIKEYSLEKRGRDSFYNLRKDYNKNKHPIKLLVLLLYTFNYQIRFNSKGEFNNPIGLGGYTNVKKQQIIRFVKNIQTKDIIFTSKNFEDLEFASSKETLHYFDPPYLITKASYNDGKRGGTGWNTNLEEKLLLKISNLNRNGGKFILSNVITHNGKTNHILDSWINENNFKVKKLTYKNREEVVIYNF